MKLAEALILRSDMQKKLEALRSRIAQNAVVQDGQQPHEDPSQLLAEAHGVLAQREALVVRINTANQQALLPDGQPLAIAIVHRDRLAAQHALIIAAVASTNKEPDRYSMREIKWIATLDIKSLHRQADDLAKNIRDLNIMIQQANWNTEVPE